MNLDLDADERLLLIQLLEREFHDLGPEVRHTRTSSYRDELKAQKHKLKVLLDRLNDLRDS